MFYYSWSGGGKKPHARPKKEVRHMRTVVGFTVVIVFIAALMLAGQLVIAIQQALHTVGI
jgi:hypothetical protein